MCSSLSRLLRASRQPSRGGTARITRPSRATSLALSRAPRPHACCADRFIDQSNSGGVTSAFLWPGLLAARLAKLFDNTIDYSLGKTAQQALWLPTSREAKYKAKQAVNSFFMRAGDVLAAALVFIGERLAFALPTFAAVNVALAIVWALILSRLAPENRRRMEEAAAKAA